MSCAAQTSFRVPCLIKSKVQDVRLFTSSCDKADLSAGAHLGGHIVPELLQLLLTNHPSVAKPPPIRLDPCVGQLLGLELLCR